MIQRALFLLLLLATNANAVIRYVDNTSPGGNDGLSWATAWDNLTQITGVVPGDTVYISGGTTSKTYNVGAGFSIPAGNSSNRFTLSVGQEAGHDSLVILTGSAGELITNNVDYWTVDGRVAGTGQHIQCGGPDLFHNPHDGAVRTGIKILGVRFLNGSRLHVRRCTQIEIAYCTFAEWIQSSSGSEQPHIFGTGDEGGLAPVNSGFGVNSIHHNVMRQYYTQTPVQPSGTNGNDYIKEPQSTDIYNNEFIGVLRTPVQFVGADHQDMIQTNSDDDLRIFNNYFENSSNYMIYWEFFNAGTKSNMYIYNNVFNYSDSVLTSNPSGAIVIGDHNSGSLWTNVKIWNNTFRGGNISIAFANANNTTANSHVQNNLHMTGAGGNVMLGNQSGVTNSNNVTGVPATYFANVGAGNFRLTASAINAINTGVSSPASTVFTTDADGNQRTGTWDVGAYEFGSGQGDPVPFVNTATINPAGTHVTIVFSETVQIGAGGPNGWVLNMSGGTITIPAQTPTGTGATRTYAFSSVRTVGNSETGTIVYTQPGNGIEDLVGGDMATGTGATVTNTSTVPTTSAPTIAPAQGSFFGTQNVTMTSSTPGATIRYTINGTDPTASSTLYSGAIPTSISTTYRAKAFAGGFIDSNITSASYEIGTWATSGTDWKSFPVTSQTGTFTWTFRASAAQAASDVVIGLSSVLPDGFNDLGPIIQFFTDNTIKARNGATYTSVNNFTYTPGTTYEIACTINIANRTYSATAAQISGTPVVIATNYAWRSDSPVAPELDNFGMNAFAGGATVSQMAFGGAASIPTLTSATIGASGTTLTLGFSESVVYGTGGSGGWTISTFGGAATLTPTANPTTFTVSRPIATGETGTISYTQPGNGVEAVTGGGDLATLTSFAFNNQSSADLTPPIPNPMTFSAIPSAPSSFSATMTASVATDVSTPPVFYYFDETSGNPGGNDSGWTTQRTYTNNGLSPGIQYTYRVMARDSAAVPNQTTPSSSVNITTPIVAGGKVVTPAGTTGAGFFNP